MPVQQEVDFRGLGIILLCTLAEKQDAKPAQHRSSQLRWNTKFQTGHILALFNIFSLFMAHWKKVCLTKLLKQPRYCQWR